MTQVQALQEYKVTAINSSSGILYQHLGKAQIASQEYTLLNYYNLTLVSKQIRFINTYYHDSLSICSLAISEHYKRKCKTQLRYINTKLGDIMRLFRIISHQLNIGSNRKKRGLMNFIGNGISYLFGNPNADDATFYSNAINSLIANEKQTHTLMQQQVSIISDTISNFNHSLFRMNENIEIMNRNLKTFNNLSNSIKDMTRKLDLEVQLSNHMILLIEMTDEVNQLLENYVNDVSLIQNGIISFRMFSSLVCRFL